MTGQRPGETPEITSAVLDQWAESAQADAEAGRAWSVNPLAILAVVQELRAVRGAPLRRGQQSRPGEVDAIGEAARVWWNEHGSVADVIAAAYPIIAAAVAEQIAQRIDQVRARHFTQYGNEETGPRNWALTHMAVLAREYGKEASRG